MSPIKIMFVRVCKMEKLRNRVRKTLNCFVINQYFSYFGNI